MTALLTAGPAGAGTIIDHADRDGVAAWPQPYQTNAGTISVTFTISPPVGNQFFLLHQP